MLSPPPLRNNSSVKVSVDPTNRQLLSEYHTAGHVVDAAMARCDKLLPPTKGYHFLDGPYVEYKGGIDVQDREEFLSQLNEAYQQLIDEDICRISSKAACRTTYTLHAFLCSDQLAF